MLLRHLTSALPSSPPMAAFSFSPLSSSFIPSKTSSPHLLSPLSPFLRIKFLSSPKYPLLQASRRISNYTQEATLLTGPRDWGGANFDEEDVSDDEDDEDRSLDLLVRFIQNVFRKVSRRARRSVRSVLPIAISARLVRFSVNGVLILTFLWVLKAFLEVVCTLASIVFVSILLIRGVWAGVTYWGESLNSKSSGFNDENGAWTSARPAT